MRTISYIPSNDTLRLNLGTRKQSPAKTVGPFKIWWDNGVIKSLEITSIEKLKEEFRRDLHTIRLRGLWKDTKIKNSDIKNARKELLSLLEEKW